MSALSYLFDGGRGRLRLLRDRFFNPDAYAFYSRTMEHGYPGLIDVLPEHRLIYVAIPKCASLTIRIALGTLIKGRRPSLEDIYRRRRAGLRGPRQVGPSIYHRVALDPSALRFSFVRNPYARLVSAWVDKFEGKPLARGDSEPDVDQYLKHRHSIDPNLPFGAHRTLSFADFVTYATATSASGLDDHWQLQDEILSVPDLELNHIGRLENFDRDFLSVLNHVGANAEFRHRAMIPTRRARPSPAAYRDYYTSELADRVYRTYQRDFDRFGYSRELPT